MNFFHQVVLCEQFRSLTFVALLKDHSYLYNWRRPNLLWLELYNRSSSLYRSYILRAEPHLILGNILYISTIIADSRLKNLENIQTKYYLILKEMEQRKLQKIKFRLRESITLEKPQKKFPEKYFIWWKISAKITKEIKFRNFRPLQAFWG